MTTAKKVVQIYAEVSHNLQEYRVYENGTVVKWIFFGDVDGDWIVQDEYDYGYDEVKKAGLEVLK